MGYCISLTNSNFEIKKRKVAGAVQAIRDLDDGTKYCWVDNDFSKLTTIEDLLAAWRFECERDANGDILFICWDGEKYGNEDALFSAIAPFVSAGSFLEWQGEDGAMWRNVFDGKTVKKVQAKIVWD